eukprot:PITA_05404
MVEEYDSIIWNSVWDVVPRLADKSVVSSRWLYKVTQAVDGNVEKHKARFVARGFSRVKGIDYDETFAPVARIDSYFSRLDFTKSEADTNLYHIMVEGMEVWQKDGEVFVSQGKYANEILRRFHMEKCKPMQSPLASNWRKEDATLGELSQAMVQPTKLFWKEMKHVLRYLRGTSQYGLWYRQTNGVKLQGFTDVDWAGSPLD